MKCKTARKAMLLYLNLCLSVILDSLSCSYTPIYFLTRGRRCRRPMVVGVIATCAISVYHH